MIKTLCKYPGQNSCVLHFADTGKSLSMGDKIKVDLSKSLVKELESILGEKNIVIK